MCEVIRTFVRNRVRKGVRRKARREQREGDGGKVFSVRGDKDARPQGRPRRCQETCDKGKVLRERC